jgi:hypothetical protein
VFAAQGGIPSTIPSRPTLSKGIAVMSIQGVTICVVFHRAFDDYGNRLKGQFVAMLGDQPLCISSNPFADAAHILLMAGYHPDLRIVGRPVEASHDTLTSTIAEAAMWKIEKKGNVLPFRPVRT